MTVHLTVAGVLAAMTAAVEARGRDYVYQSPAGGYCRYVHDGCASCLVGDTLYRCGVPLDVLARHEGVSAYSLVDDLRRSWVATAEVGVGAVLKAAQRVQDNSVAPGGTWGEALDAAAAVVAARAVAS